MCRYDVHHSLLSASYFMSICAWMCTFSGFHILYASSFYNIYTFIFGSPYPLILYNIYTFILYCLHTSCVREKIHHGLQSFFIHALQNIFIMIYKICSLCLTNTSVHYLIYACINDLQNIYIHYLRDICSLLTKHIHCSWIIHTFTIHNTCTALITIHIHGVGSQNLAS